MLAQISFRNPVTRKTTTVSRISALGRAAAAVRADERGARQTLRRLCVDMARQEAISLFSARKDLQRGALVKAAVRSGRTISWRSYAPGPWFPTWNDHVHGVLEAL